MFETATAILKKVMEVMGKRWIVLYSYEEYQSEMNGPK